MMIEIDESNEGICDCCGKSINEKCVVITEWSYIGRIEIHVDCAVALRVALINIENVS